MSCNHLSEIVDIIPVVRKLGNSISSDDFMLFILLCNELLLPIFSFFFMMFNPVTAKNNEKGYQNCNNDPDNDPFCFRFLWHCSLVNSNFIESCRGEFVGTLKTHVTFVSLYEVLSSLKLEIWTV